MLTKPKDKTPIYMGWGFGAFFFILLFLASCTVMADRSKNKIMHIVTLRPSEAVVVPDSSSPVLVLATHESYFVLRNETSGEDPFESRPTQAGSHFREILVGPGDTLRLETNENIEVFLRNSDGTLLKTKIELKGKTLLILGVCSLVVAIGGGWFMAYAFKVAGEAGESLANELKSRRGSEREGYHLSEEQDSRRDWHQL